MTLSLKDLLKKGEEKGLGKQKAHSSPAPHPFSPWHEESVLFNEPNLGNKLENRSDNKIDNESEVKTDNKKENKLGNNQGTFREHLGNLSGTSREQLGNKIENIQGTYREPIREQTRNVLEIELGNESENELIRLELLRLNGIQRNLFTYAFDLCMLRADGTTGFILTQIMAETINCTYESAKVSLKRLIKKGLVLRNKGKTSRGGFIILSIPKEVKALALQLRLGNKSGNGIENKSETAYPHYSNSNKTTTIIQEEFEKIDITPLAHIGLTMKHLTHLKNCTDEAIQDSINHFAWGLKNNKRVGEYKDPLNVFIGTLRKGIAWVEASYVSPQEIALQEKLEARKREKGRMAKLEEEMLDLEFSDWLVKLPEPEREAIWPASKRGMPQDVALKNHFRETLWPAIKAKI